MCRPASSNRQPCSAVRSTTHAHTRRRSEEIDRHVLRKYEVVQKLGKGAYGIVWRAMDKRTREVVALKKIFDAFQNATDAQRTFREIMFLQARPALPLAHICSRCTMPTQSTCTPSPPQEMAGHEHIVTLVNCLKADKCAAGFRVERARLEPPPCVCPTAAIATSTWCSS